MASTNKTENYKLNQWVKTDPVLMDDFNEDNRKIDAAMMGIMDAMPRIQTGSYVGDDEYGSGSPNVLSFDFEPKLLCVGGMAVARGHDAYAASGGYCYFTWDGKTVSWYSPQSASVQQNSSLSTYHYFAVG